MPTYEYFCPGNEARVEVLHGFNETVVTWGELCRLAEISPGNTPLDEPIRKVITAPNIAFPKGNSELKNMGFTKLVKREKGVYENVTATGNESRYTNAGDSSTMPDFSKKIRD